MTDRWKSPVLSLEERKREVEKMTTHTKTCSLQGKSPLFSLPREVRNLVYLELFGDRLVHVDYDYRPLAVFLTHITMKGSGCIESVS